MTLTMAMQRKFSATTYVLVSIFVVACQEAPVAVLAAGANLVPAQRIVSLAPHITELSFAAGAGSKLVGAVEYSDFPAEALRVARIGDAFRVDYEALALLKPDLILAWESGTPQETVERLRSLGYNLVELEPGSLEDIVAELRMVGALAGTSAVADKRAATMEQEIELLRSSYSDREKLDVFFQISTEPLFTVAGDHVISDILELCGGRNVFAALPGIAPPVSTEAVLAAAPEAILAMRENDNTSWQAFWRPWQQLPAVAAGNMFGIDSDLISRSGPRIVAGTRQVCEALAQARANIR